MLSDGGGSGGGGGDEGTPQPTVAGKNKIETGTTAAADGVNTDGG